MAHAVQVDLQLQCCYYACEIHFHTTIQYNVEVATNGPTYGRLLCCVGQDTGITKIRFNLFRRVHLKRHKRLFINIVMKRSILHAAFV